MELCDEFQMVIRLSRPFSRSVRLVDAHLRQARHGLAPGSREDLGHFSIPADPLPIAVVGESGIDGIICFASIQDAIACPAPAPGPTYTGCKSYWAKAARFTGCSANATADQTAHAIMAPEAAIKRLRPSQHGWGRRAPGASVG